MAVSTQIDFLLSMVETGTSRDFESPAIRVNYSRSLSILNGTGEGQSDVRWSSHRHLGSLADEDINLSNLTGDFGQALTFARLTGIIIVSAPPDFGGVVVSRPANGVPIFSADGDTITVIGRGMWAWIGHRGSPPGVAVTAGTGDLIHLQAGISSADFDIHLFGTSA